MFTPSVRPILVFALLVAAGCATVPDRDPVLEDARVAVYAARNNPQVGQYSPVELDQAAVTLRDADNLAARGGNINEVHRLALLAQQRAALAQDTARLRSAEAALAVQRNAREAQLQADLSRRQAETAQLQAASAQRQAEEAQRQAAATQLQAQALLVPNTVVAVDPPFDVIALPSPRGLVVTLDDTMFDSGSAQLRPGATHTIQKLAAWLAAHPERTIAIEGYADTSGSRNFDQRLSEQRALAVQAALVNMGIDPRRMIARGYGRDYPVATNATPAGRQMNRRVEIVVSDTAGVIVPRG